MENQWCLNQFHMISLEKLKTDIKMERIHMSIAQCCRNIVQHWMTFARHRHDIHMKYPRSYYDIMQELFDVEQYSYDIVRCSSKHRSMLNNGILWPWYNLLFTFKSNAWLRKPLHFSTLLEPSPCCQDSLRRRDEPAAHEPAAHEPEPPQDPAHVQARSQGSRYSKQNSRM